MNNRLVSKETAASRQWGSETLTFCIKQVEMGQIAISREKIKKLTFQGCSSLTEASLVEAFSRFFLAFSINKDATLNPW